MLSERQTSLLKLIVEEYIKTAHAISSKSLCDHLDCSSATIRNEMSTLEDLGLLEKTHVSSGRIPSESGYRYYVDNIMEPKKITGEDVLKLQTIFHNKSLVLSDAITKSMDIITELTSYTTIVLGTSSKDNRVSKVEAVPIDENRVVAVIITDKGHVEHRNVYIEVQVSSEEIRQTIEIINKLIIGTPIDEVSSKLEYEVKPVISKYVAQHEAIYNAFYNAFSEFSNETNIRVAGASNILKQPEFDNTNKVREILKKLNDENIISRIREEDSGINIYIGSESEFDNDVGVIKTRYDINGETGTIAIIGPKRMEYDRVSSLLEYIKENIGG